MERPHTYRMLTDPLGEPRSAAEWALHLMGRSEERDGEVDLSDPSAVMRVIEARSRRWMPLDPQSAFAMRLEQRVRLGYVDRPLPMAQQHPDDERTPRYEGEGAGVEDERGRQRRPPSEFVPILGCIGMGKSETAERVLAAWPRVYPHPARDALRPSWKQLIYLHATMPSAGSLVTLFRELLEQALELTGVDITKQAKSSIRTADDWERQLRKVCVKHALGLLVIDEVNNISAQKALGFEALLNRFGTLLANMRVPVCYIGSPVAAALIQSAGRTARRSAENAKVWNPWNIKQAEWSQFAEMLWQTRIVEPTRAFDEGVTRALWDASGGVPHFARIAFNNAMYHAVKTEGRVIDLKDMVRKAHQDPLIGHFVMDVLAQHDGKPGRFADTQFIRPL